MSDRPPRHGQVRGYPRDEDGWPLCRYCLTRCPSKRRTFCSDACVAEWTIRSNPATARLYVKGRDKGVCAGCGLDTTPLYEALAAARRALPYTPSRNPEAAAAYDALALPLRERGFASVRLSDALRPAQWVQEGWFWQMDHIIPVEHGGGMTGLDGLQTLCTPCHKAKTAAQAKQRRKSG